MAYSTHRPKIINALKEQALARQDHRCIYCGVEFGSVEVLRGKSIVATIEWDHFVPFILAGNMQHGNIVAACSVCNKIKMASVFDTVEQAREYILKKRAAKMVVAHTSICAACGDSFQSKRADKRKFCSRACSQNRHFIRKAL